MEGKKGETMKVLINGYLVEVGKVIDNDYPSLKKDSRNYFLNELSIVYRNAANYQKSIGCTVTAESFESTAHELHEFLTKKHFYDDIK